MSIELLPDALQGKGETKGFEFRKSKVTDTHYVFAVNTGESEHFEVFLRKYTPICLDFEKRLYSETDFKEIYPKSNDFGVWAWSLPTLEAALAKLTNN